MGRVYKGVIRNVVPSINGMFIDIGIGKNGFLRTKDILSKEPHTEGGCRQQPASSLDAPVEGHYPAPELPP